MLHVAAGEVSQGPQQERLCGDRLVERHRDMANYGRDNHMLQIACEINIKFV